jgi:hypothetical protein
MTLSAMPYIDRGKSGLPSHRYGLPELPQFGIADKSAVTVSALTDNATSLLENARTQRWRGIRPRNGQREVLSRPDRADFRNDLWHRSVRFPC